MTSCRNDGRPPRERDRASGHIGFDVVQPTALRGVDDPLRGDTEDWLDRVAGRGADADDLGANLDGNPPRQRLGADFGGPVAAQTGKRIGHAVRGHLRPALAEQVRRRLAGRHGIHDLREGVGARRSAAVELANLEPDGAAVGAHRVAWFVQARADRDHAAERALAAGQRRHTLVVDAVLEIDDHAVAGLQEANGEQRRPVGIVALDRQEHVVERLVDRLRLVEMQRAHLKDVVAARATQTQAVAFDRIDVRWPLVDQRHIVTSQGELAADDRANCPSAHDADARHAFLLKQGHTLTRPRPRGRATGGG